MQTDKSRIYQAGYNRGYDIASYQDIPEIGAQWPKTDDFFSTGKQIIYDKNDQEEAFLNLCFDAEENNRSYSPFEYTANELNNMVENKPYDPWDVYDGATYKGFIDNFNKRVK